MTIHLQMKREYETEYVSTYSLQQKNKKGEKN